MRQVRLWSHRYPCIHVQTPAGTAISRITTIATLPTSFSCAMMSILPQLRIPQPQPLQYFKMQSSSRPLQPLQLSLAASPPSRTLQTARVQEQKIRCTDVVRLPCPDRSRHRPTIDTRIYENCLVPSNTRPAPAKQLHKATVEWQNLGEFTQRRTRDYGVSRRHFPR